MSSVFKQAVNPLPTMTTLSIVTQSLRHGRMIEYILVATIAPAGGSPTTSPAGVVLFAETAGLSVRPRLSRESPRPSWAAADRAAS